LKRIVEFREMTLSAPTCERVAVRASVMPSTKYSWAGSPEGLMDDTWGMRGGDPGE
jgi:hypothetical protein